MLKSTTTVTQRFNVVEDDGESRAIRVVELLGLSAARSKSFAYLKRLGIVSFRDGMVTSR